MSVAIRGKPKVSRSKRLEIALSHFDAAASRWQLTNAERAKVLGLDVVDGNDDQTEAEFTRGARACSLTRLATVLEIDAILGRGEIDLRDVPAWLRQASEALGGESPLAMLTSSQRHIEQFFRALQFEATANLGADRSVARSERYSGRRF